VNVTPATLPWPAVVAPERLIPPTSLASAEAPDAANLPSGAAAPEIDIHLAPPRRGTPLAIAHAAWRRGDWATARTAYLAARAQTPRLAEPELGLAALALREGASAVAASHYHAALRLDPTNPIARIGLLSETPASVGRRDLAQESRNPRELAHFHYALGQAAAATGQWALAVALDHLGLETEAAGYYRRALADWSAARAGFDPAPIRLRLQALNAEF
jgi:tetratricopeptide (TPR) repeat protein